MKKLIKKLTMASVLLSLFMLVACGTRDEVLQPATVSIAVGVDVGDSSPEKFTFVLETVSQERGEDFTDAPFEMPLPDGSSQIEIYGGANANFDNLTFERAGTFVYRVVQRGLEVEDDAWLIDERIFDVTITVTATGNQLVADVMYTVNGAEVAEIRFVNQSISLPYIGVTGIPENYATEISHADGMSYLALVNRHFRLSSDFSPADLSVVNALNIYGNMNQWIQMRATAARAMELMLDTAYEDEGHVIIIVSGYRSYETQTSVHNNHIANRGEAEARRVSARPGHSEHQLGLAMDLSTFGLGGQLSSQFSSTPEGNWIKNHAHRFGFIIRYPANREPDTGFIYEPWHLRYIGVEAATQMYGTGWILEEFLLRN